MQIHRFVALLASAMLHETRTTTFNLHSASRLLLDVFNMSTSLANNLSAKVEPRNRVEVDGNFLFWPFALGDYLVFHITANHEDNLPDQIHLFRQHQAPFV
jgi:hypothetical protein